MQIDDALRNQIDALDETIANLVVERSHLSRKLWEAREDAGGPRVDITRERNIRTHYSSVVGHDGGYLADAILQICRGYN